MELLSPAGEYDSAIFAIEFGADAIFLADKNFGMRSNSRNFDIDQMKNIVDYAHNKNKKVYVTLNILPTNSEVSLIKDYIDELENVEVDAVIVADIGLLTLVKETAPNLPVHISTQSGVTNYQSANALYTLGASRVVLAREMSIEDIEETITMSNPNLEFEVFVHGSMCMSFSGRCFLSQYLNARDANHGDCSQPCRWEYCAKIKTSSQIPQKFESENTRVTDYILEGEIFEKTRPNMPIPIVEDENGTSILSAQDMNMIKYLDKLKDIGVNSIKIEGRAKGAYYSGVITNSYRSVLNLLESKSTEIIETSEQDKEIDYWYNETLNVSHRPYSTGFYFSGPMGSKRIPPTQDYGKQYIRNRKFLADIYNLQDNQAQIKLRNKLSIGDTVEIIVPGKIYENIKILDIKDSFNNTISTINKTLNKYFVTFNKKFENNNFGLMRSIVDPELPQT